METKQSEADFAYMCGRLNIWCHKWRDVMYCPTCRKPIFMTRRIDPKDKTGSESIVDYLVFFGDKPMWVECKGKPGHTRLPLAEIAVQQANFQMSWLRRGVMASLFVTLGNGRAPDRRWAWWIPWEVWMSTAKLCLQIGQKSIPADPQNLLKREQVIMTDFKDYQLQWLKGGWLIPQEHPYWDFAKGLPLLYDNNITTS